ncbi:helix-turn-helix domain-containing protein [Actinomadura sp. NBRC 104412]|uniref:winged helix-turn-helix transcriptional regulator n=1 Tax=Actinomadura sp. NBRC 104412 TaxID=3032203 RepID=UPI0025558D95|nr:helix-turn-helix domain-containing protein [Actinomadura sp. NBRC 104412]
MTAEQRRSAAKAAHEEYMATCPTHQLLDIMSAKWASLILIELAGGTRRFADIGRALPSASAKMLTQTLRSLERDGFLTRSVTPAVPVQVEYTLTPMGASLIPLLAAAKDWADANIGAIHSARARYDADNA